MPGNNYYIILFYTIHDVLRAEKILKKHNIAHELVPVPRNLSSDCGMCVKLPDNREKTLPLLSAIEISGCYDKDGKHIN
ncbi:MAG: DUF3343 domain-containing protein [Syntrophorhabdus sp.]